MVTHLRFIFRRQALLFYLVEFGQDFFFLFLFLIYVNTYTDIVNVVLNSTLCFDVI